MSYIIFVDSFKGMAGLVLGSCYGYFSRKVMVFTGLKGAGTFYLISCSFLGKFPSILKEE